MKDEYYVFPFEKVNKDSKIFIYGMGNVGKQFYYQIEKTRYCEVVSFVDRNRWDNNITRFRCISPNEIKKEIINYNIEYIVIAIDSESEQLKIKEDLINNYGVDEKMIVVSADRGVSVGQIEYNIDTALISFDSFNACINEFLKCKNGDISFFDVFLDDIEVLSDFEREFVYKKILSYFHMCSDIQKKVIILRMLYHLELFSSECMDLLFETVGAINDVERRIWLSYDISVMECRNEKVRSKDFYKQKRNLFKRNIRELVSLKNYLKKNIGELKKIAVISFGLGNKSSSHNGLIVPYVNEMVNQGFEVAVFPCQLLKYRYGESYIIPLDPIEMESEIWEKEHKELFDSKITINYNVGNSMKERAENFLEALNDYSPDLVVDFCGEYSFYSPLFSELYTTIAIPMRGYSSSSCFDIYLSGDKNLCIKENEKYHSMEINQIEEGLICSLPVNPNKKYERKTYNIPENAFVIVTVGNRLKYELTKDFVEVVIEFLNKNKEAVWILVGDENNSYTKKIYSNLYEECRIIDWGYERDLMGMYNIVDIYWNPNRMGAGGSIGMAMRAGIPIVTTTFPSDVLPRLGMNNAIDGDYRECSIYAQKLLDDKAFWKEKSELMKSRMEISSVKQYIIHMLEVVRARYSNNEKF